MEKNAEYYGYKVGDRFRYRDDVKESSKVAEFRGVVGNVLTLEEDDGTYCPRFSNIDGFMSYEYLDHLVKIEEESTTLKPQDLGCWRQVVGVIGEERAAVELQKVIDIKDNSGVSFSKEANEVCYTFVWSTTPQGYPFWSDIDDGVDPGQHEDIHKNEEFVEAVKVDNVVIDEAVGGIVVRQCDIPEGCTVSVERDKVSISFDHKYYFVTSVEAYEKTMQAVRLLVEAKEV